MNRIKHLVSPRRLVLAMMATFISSSYSYGAVCASPWSEGSNYTSGQIVSYLGNNYKSLQSHTAYQGSGWNPASTPTLWSLLETCNNQPSPTAVSTTKPTTPPIPTSAPSTLPTATPASTPLPTSGCYEQWKTVTAYIAGAKVTYNTRNYQALWWTQGETPATNVGAGKPWQDLGECSALPQVTSKPAITPTATSVPVQTPSPTLKPTATPTPKPTATPTPLPSPTPVKNGFRHPGVLVDLTQLNYVRQQVKNGVEPFFTAYNKAKNSDLGALNYKTLGPPDDQIIDCGPSSNPDHGCYEEKHDSSAAYTQALLWYISGNEQYAKNAISIMNAWSRGLTRGHTNSNAPLQSAWAAENWPAAAEIIRYTYNGWSSGDVAAFQRMLRDQYLPYISGGNLYTGKNGNWSLSMIDAMLGIAVFNEDRTLFNSAVSSWKKFVPAYIYNYSLDGSSPVTFSGGPNSWNGQTTFTASTSGVSQETCRDTQHVALGMAALFNGAETAYIQGVDLYTPNKTRLTTSLEYHSRMLQGVTNLSQTKKFPVPAGFPGLCNGQYTPVLKATMERAYNAYHNRLGVNLPQTLKHLINDVRPKADPNDEHSVIWETLTHGTIED